MANIMTTSFGQTCRKRAAPNLEHEVHFLRKALSSQRHYIDSVHETTIGLISNDKVEDLLERILSKAGRLAGTPDTFLYLYDSDSDELFIKLGQGIYTDLLGTRIKTNQGLAGEVYNTGKAILIDDYATWSRRIQHPIYDKLHSAIGIPLKSKTSIVGVIGLGSFDSQKPFGRSDRENMHRFAELASIALENARINTELKNELKVRKNAEKALRKLNMELEKRVAERTMRLEKAFSEIKTLKGILPICSHCKKIRNDEGYWTQIESYIKEHSEAQLSHGICLDCAKKYYPDIDIYEE
nr:GAF domain-containing protein [uncultured Desulfobacter sp.]